MIVHGVVSYSMSAATLVTSEMFSSIKDSLEASIIKSAPFVAGLLECILGFQKCRNAPLRTHFIDVISYDTNRNKVNLE
jgi:hypothetical protein